MSNTERDSDLSLHIYCQSVVLQQLGLKSSVSHQWNPVEAVFCPCLVLMSTEYFFPICLFKTGYQRFLWPYAPSQTQEASCFAILLFAIYCSQEECCVTPPAGVSLRVLSNSRQQLHCTPVLFCLLICHSFSKLFTLWLDSSCLIKMQLFW